MHVPEQLSSAIARPRRHVEAVLAQSLYEVGPDGRAALAWQWALTGTRPSPVTLSLAPGRPPSREEILAEAAAEPEGSTAPPEVPSEFCDQLRETRAVLAWLAGGSDEIPVDDDNCGRFIGARGDYARTDDDIRQVLDHALLDLRAFDLPEPMSLSDAKHPGSETPPEGMPPGFAASATSLVGFSARPPRHRSAGALWACRPPTTSHTKKPPPTSSCKAAPAATPSSPRHPSHHLLATWRDNSTSHRPQWPQPVLRRLSASKLYMTF